MNFDAMKRRYLKGLEEAKRKGEADEPIFYLLDLINSLPDFFTTSSCAGRITLMKIPKSGKKNESEFIFKTHYQVNPEKVWESLLQSYEKYEDSIWFKMEPWIVHISARDIQSANKMLIAARNAGLKRAGIFLISNERVMLEIQSTERIETVVAKNRNLLVSKDYIEILVHEANQKLQRTRKRMKRFYDSIREVFEL